jgi:hypothetical protein
MEYGYFLCHMSISTIIKKKKKKKNVTQSRTGLQIYEGHDDQLNRPGPMA